jgi:trigger factor
MTDETRPEGQPREGGPGLAEQAPVAEEQTTPAAPAEEPTSEAAPAEEKQEGPSKLHQNVEIRDIGPCRKHIKVTVERKDIDERLNEQFKKLVTESVVAGFRPGKAPRALVQRRYHKEVGDQVKTEVLVASLEQLGEDHDIAPLSPPDLDPGKIDLPAQGPLVYEFEVEVRPHFDLPDYKGLRLKRPVKTFGPDDVEQAKRRLLAPYGQIVPKPEGNAGVGDILIADVSTRFGARELGTMKEASVRVEKQLAFKDGIARRFAEQVKGANAGDTRVVDIQLSQAVGDETLRGQTVQATFVIQDVKTLRLPALTHEFLHNFGVHSPEQFHELVEVLLRRQLEHQQRQAARQQVLDQILSAATWDLPKDMLMRQAGKAMARRVMEMRADGIPEQEIAQRRRLLEQDVLQSTAQSLKEYFVLQKIAEVEKIEVNEDDLDEEIERLAAQADESPRRVRARLEKENLLDDLAAEMVERKALDLILDHAQYEDVPLDPEEQPALATVEAQAVPGEMHDPTAPPPAEQAPAQPGGEASPGEQPQ